MSAIVPGVRRCMGDGVGADGEQRGTPNGAPTALTGFGHPARAAQSQQPHRAACGTDAFNFNAAGIPASGVLTGQDCCKTQGDVDLFGGSLGNFEGNVPSFDGGCVDNPFRWCDNLANNDPDVLTSMSRWFANMVVQMAFDTTVLSSSGRSVHSRALPIPTNAGQRASTR
jgi:hypothetical protein